MKHKGFNELRHFQLEGHSLRKKESLAKTILKENSNRSLFKKSFQYVLGIFLSLKFERGLILASVASRNRRIASLKSPHPLENVPSLDFGFPIFQKKITKEKKNISFD